MGTARAIVTLLTNVTNRGIGVAWWTGDTLAGTSKGIITILPLVTGAGGTVRAIVAFGTLFAIITGAALVFADIAIHTGYQFWIGTFLTIRAGKAGFTLVAAGAGEVATTDTDSIFLITGAVFTTIGTAGGDNVGIAIIGVIIGFITYSVSMLRSDRPRRNYIGILIGLGLFLLGRSGVRWGCPTGSIGPTTAIYPVKSQ